MPEHNDDHALLTTDRVWWQSFDFQTQELADNNGGQLALWPVDDLMSVKRYVGCPDRGTCEDHRVLALLRRLGLGARKGVRPAGARRRTAGVLMTADKKCQRLGGDCEDVSSALAGAAGRQRSATFPAPGVFHRGSACQS